MRIFLYRFLILTLFLSRHSEAQTFLRKDISLDNNWFTTANDSLSNAFAHFEQNTFSVATWENVNVPHNWDQYEGYRRMLHGNKHGYAWYRKSFKVKEQKQGKRFFLYFEGVSSYATVWLNGKKVGTHAGGRTTFTLDVTTYILLDNQANTLAVRADHPANIQDLPWVCGGCSPERGFSEGSQPMGIFRPVHLIVTNEVRIAPFGVHIWNDSTASEKSATLKISTEIKNYGKASATITILNELIDKTGVTITKAETQEKVTSNTTLTINQQFLPINHPHLWSLADPYLYQLRTSVFENGKKIDEIKTDYGIRTISWPIGKKDSKQFLLNGKAVFINGIAEYEHLIGNSHAFSKEQIYARVQQIKSAGFNAFRDAHQPHNLDYQQYWDKSGILWWPQMAAHVWYDTPAFRENFKTLLKDWVKERRNSPSIVLWGLENESTLPEDFARECSDIIRQLDPTASSQRKITTCNGGKGTDWDVPQNWTGTYGGDPNLYGQDVERQVLIGEYGAWRTLDLHKKEGFSEDKMTNLMELKVRLAEAAKDKTTGHFFWLFNSHDNPGRVQGGEGLRELDRVGPVNYKGLLTPWEEPLDVFYMFRANYASKITEPMVYIASHTWPDRWTATGKKDSIVVYSNADEVELFNDIDNVSLGKRKRNGVGSHFQWDDVDIQYNVLYAIAYVNGKAVAKDYIVLNHLPEAPHFKVLYQGKQDLVNPQKDYHYLYRVNCGGNQLTDKQGNKWLADQHKTNKNTWGSSSWTDDFEGIPNFFASQRRTFDPIKGTSDWKLFQTFRYGREKLKYHFDVPDGEYLVELYFIEPWFGAGGGMDCTGWRLFDVAVNEKTVLKNLDIWKEVGHDGALKKTIKVKISGGQLVISFPNIKSGQTLISAIAIASLDKKIKATTTNSSLIKSEEIPLSKIQHWLDTGEKVYADDEAKIVSLPANLFGSESLQFTENDSSEKLTFTVNENVDVFVAIAETVMQKPAWLASFEETGLLIQTTYQNGVSFKVLRKRFLKGEKVVLGANSEKSPHYLVMINQTSTIEPAYDLKTIKSYKATKAQLSGTGVMKEFLMEKERVSFKNPSAGVMEWTIAVGVADTYSLTIKYYNPTEQSLKVRLDMVTTNGTVIKKGDLIVFPPSKKGKWSYYNTSTGTMINAGTYQLKLTSEDAENLSIDALDVQ
ncbi:malectin domain-containing carbohydrate-binding protein [Arcicella aquatica]|uniref:Malectin domain-containing carbohydrate-binding protein n=1 Tax=Arcicella aquatica TaxID=217141 RepID=A0ABU5QL73_9BACT|nr:malectin domain-containing carbohydrate-binding protein [Arcicella aquatica]MEA5257802.1 malectin domain-containing carbohydrate-binding protein [Arcicella aquatica]